MTKLLAATALTLALLAAPAGAQIYAPVTAKVDGARCTGTPIKQCSVPSGRRLTFSGSEVDVGGEELPEGTPVRVATAGPDGPVSVGEATLVDFPAWRISFRPLRTGVVYAAQVLVGGEWLTIPSSQARANVFVEIVGGQLAYGPRLPVTARGTVGWAGRDGAGRAELRRCRHAAPSRCTARRHFTRLVASTPVRRPGTFVFSTRSPLAYGRPLALVYAPRSDRLDGDLVTFRARSR